MYKDLETCHDWPLVDLPISLTGNLKHTSGNYSLSPLVAYNNDLCAAS